MSHAAILIASLRARWRHLIAIRTAPRDCMSYAATLFAGMLATLRLLKSMLPSVGVQAGMSYATTLVGVLLFTWKQSDEMAPLAGAKD